MIPSASGQLAPTAEPVGSTWRTINARPSCMPACFSRTREPHGEVCRVESSEVMQQRTVYLAREKGTKSHLLWIISNGMTADGRLPIVVWSIAQLAAGITALPTSGPLPCRTVLVPHERLAHALRRELIRTGHAQALAGTRFITPTAAAAAVLTAAGATFRPGEERLRTARLRTLFQIPLPLQHFSQELLRSRPGWDEAFAHTIGDLEQAGLDPRTWSAPMALRWTGPGF